MPRAFGISCDLFRDGLDIHVDTDTPIVSGGIDIDVDHCIAMCLTLQTLIPPATSFVTAIEVIATSFLPFHDVMQHLGRLHTVDVSGAPCGHTSKYLLTTR